MEDITKLSPMLPHFLVEILVAIVCGGLIGLERGLRRKAAGLRDNILICLGSVLFMKVSELVALNVGGAAAGDPGRIAAQVVTGIGFIGAGVIIQKRGDVTGLTTAATIWVVAAIGLTIGAGYPLLGMLVTGAVLLTLTSLHGVETHFSKQPVMFVLRLTVREDSPQLRKSLEDLLASHNLQPESFRSETTPLGVKLTVKALEPPTDVRRLVSEAWTINGVTEVEH